MPKRITLSDAEYQIIQGRRAEKTKCAAALAFRNKAIFTAARWQRWSDKSSEGLTYSTFVNAFNYDRSDNREMYEAVQRILGAAWPMTEVSI